MRASLLTVLFVSLLAPGCGETIDPEPPPIEGDAALVLGGAAASGEGFIELIDGDEVELVPGSQGGFHVWTGMEVLGTEGRHYLEREARRTDDDVLVLRAIRQSLDVPSDAMIDWWRKPEAVPSFMCPTPIGVKVFDQEVTFSVKLVDEDDNVVTEDSITLIPRCPEGEHADFCLEICSG